MSELKSYAVWDASTRWFHWINALCVIALALVGFVILNAGALDVSNAGKVTLKKVHAWIGYVFVLNLLWRIAWAFLGNRYARWRAVLPGGKGYFHTVRSYVAPAAEYSPAVPFVAGFSPLAVGLLTPAVPQHLTVFHSGGRAYVPLRGERCSQYTANELARHGTRTSS